ncbi:MAG: hypothetical protein II336_01515 [Loktanella sp.]|nr:hypothetical protein [Loktanella sp.]
MDEWTNVSVILCADRSGAHLSVIEQWKKDQHRQKGSHVSFKPKSHRFVLGNGTKVKPLDENRFLLTKTQEVITRT